MNESAQARKSRLARQRRANAKRRADPAYQAKQRAWHKQWCETHGKTPERMARKAEQMRAYARAHGTRDHHKARWQVNRALVSGQLVRQPCEVCGALRVDAHHDDYSKPLAVRWLCRAHHIEHHSKATEAQS